MRVTRLWWSLVVLLVVAGACGRSTAKPSVDFSRVAVIGASLSAGFGGARVAELVDGAIAGEHAVEDLADTFMFRDPLGKARAQVDDALAFAPTVVIALDALFWCVYTPAPEAYRAERLERCLAELARIEVPLFVGDIPDMRRAASWMLPPDTVPPVDQLGRFNARVREWAARDPRRRLVPMAEWGRPLVGDDPEMRKLMSLDGLHPNRDGVRYLLRRVAREVAGGEALRGL